MPIIVVEKLKKEYRRQKRTAGLAGSVRSLFSREYETILAVDDVSFHVEEGEVVGYIGANGAGKSTTIKMLVGILVPTSGLVTVRGLVPHENRVENAKKMGVVFGQRTQLWWDIPVSESLNLMRHMFKIPEKRFNENIALFGEILDLRDFINTPVRQLSLGQRMRADICAALLHDPDILYLDEPTIGLDVVAKERIREFIKSVNRERGTTVILTTHDMSDIEKLCSRVMVIDKGSIVYDGQLQQLKEKYGTEETLTIETDGGSIDDKDLSGLGIRDVSRQGNRYTFRYDKRKVNSSSLIQFALDHCQIRDFDVQQAEIEEVIRRLYLSMADQRHG
ncbi:MAG: ATP-binding cassette domain-containing protein [Gemmatimonadetes bacterium]|nr:ATP-binding cassette domain-containing protein [Gemmatimonadota bacterium]MDE3257349.1 ATP-binding cassette domain-containing protein [Gemmatimonadota bacterium]